ncbi:MAG TPA: GC-type dockerin domain-anchored protein [Phycisphaerales bacterium]|nr:GC-type dockerin domain-anchored protein [Phycisphaerales bacterium]
MNRTTIPAALALTLIAGTAAAQTLTRVSTNYAGSQLDDGANSAVINAAGTRVVFASDQNNSLAFNVFGFPTARNGINLYLKNLTNGDVDLVSWTGYFSQPPQLGPEPLAINLNGTSSTASIASNGRVAFQNFGDQQYMNGLNNVFVNCLPSSGLNGYVYVYVGGGIRNDAHEGWNGSPCFGPFVNASMNDPCISPEGTHVAFSTSSNVPGLNTSNGTNSDTNGVADVYLKNLSTNAFTKVSLAGNVLSGFTESNGASRRPSVGNNNTHVAFESDADNLGGVDNNGNGPDIFVRDASGLFPFTERVSVTESNDAVSGNGPSTAPSISGNGRYVAFLSEATNLVLFGVSGNRQVYLRDRDTNSTIMISRGFDGIPAAADCSGARISEDGNWVVFHTAANNIVRGDTNGFSDTFVYSVQTGTTRRVSVNTPNFPPTTAFQGNNNAFAGDASNTQPDGSVRVAFDSTANNLVSGDSNGSTDVFLRTLPAIPAHDQCDDAAVAAPGVLYTGNTAGAAVDGNASCGSSTGSPDVWYVHVADRTGNIIAHTNGSAYDTVLSAQVGCNGAQLACDDDAGDGANSRISFGVTMGQNVRFRVSGFNGYFGAYNFTFNYACGQADVGSTGGVPGPDGQLNNNDFVVFIDYFFNENPLADVGSVGGVPGADGAWDNNDFVVFIDLFFAGC